ncbi:hypothetical protein [Bradyrhizobium sp. USDA 4486]
MLDPAVHRLDARHLPAVHRFFTGLDPETRWGRFGGPVSDAAAELHAVSALQDTSLMLGVFTRHRLCGILELYPRVICGEMELLLVVEQDSRGQRLGWRLVEAALRCAPLIGARSYQLAYSRDNWPMRRIAHRAQARLDLEFGTYRACIDVRHPRFVATDLESALCSDIVAQQQGFARRQVVARCE